MAILVSALVLGRNHERKSLSNALIAYSLGVFGLTNLLLYVLPAVLLVSDDAIQVWAPLSARTLAAAGFATSAFVSRRRLLSQRLTSRWPIFGAVGLTIGLTAAVFTLTADALPSAVQAFPSIETDASPRIEGHPVLLSMQLVSMVLYLLAAYGFTRRAEKTGDRMMLWFGAGSVLSAFARVHYFLAPSLYTDYVYVGDMLRLGFYVALLMGAATEIEGYWRSRSEAAALEERRRIARDLHDGLAQELVVLAAQVTRLTRCDEAAKDSATKLLMKSSQRAVAEARRAISSLVDPMDRPLSESLAQVLEEMSIPPLTKLDQRLDPTITVAPAVGEGLIRIAREAVSNALEHAHASRIWVDLKKEDVVTLRITDDGVGVFGDGLEEGKGFGIVTMRERAVALGGKLTVSSAGDRGTRVEVRLGS